MAETSANNQISLSDSEEDVGFISESNATGLRSEVASNPEEDAAWKVLVLQLRANLQKWFPHNRLAGYWAFFVIDGPSSIVKLSVAQVMRCIVCHSGFSGDHAQSSARGKKGLITYDKEHGTSALKKHVSSRHKHEYAKWLLDLEQSKPHEGERQKSKKRNRPAPSAITEFFGSGRPYNKHDPAQKAFLEDLTLYIAKSNRPLSTVEDAWLRRLVLRQCGKVVFPSRHQLVNDVMPAVVTKTMEKFVKPQLASCITCTAAFDLWMSRGGNDTFAMVVSFINDSWQPCHVTIGLFEVQSTAGTTMVEQVTNLLGSFGLLDKVVAYVKDEGANLSTLTTALTSVVSCDILQLRSPFIGTCWGHAMSKAAQYATDDSKICGGLRSVSLKTAQATLQKTITWTKKSGKGGREWKEACIDAQLRPRKLKTPVKTRFASRVILFQKTLEYRNAINICYGRQAAHLQARVPDGQTWAIAKTVTETLLPVVQQCILNQSKGFWLLSDALVSAFSLAQSMQGSICTIEAQNHPLIRGDFDSELIVTKQRMMAQVVDILAPFLAFTGSYLEVKAHNMMAIMFDPRYKSLKVIREYVGTPLATLVVAEYDMKTVMPMFLQVYKHMNPASVVPPEPLVASDEDSFFGQLISNDDALHSLLKNELYMFRCLRVAPKDCENPLAWWAIHESQFPHVAFLARQILGIVGSQIETERIFSIAGVITNLRRSKLGVDNLDRLIMISKNWPDDSRVGCEGGKVSSFNDFIESEDSLMEENEKLILDCGFFEEDEE